MKNKTGLVLIHGAGLGSFIWDDLKPLINYPTLAIDFPNREINDLANKNTSFEIYLHSAIEQVEKQDIDEIIIVAHSIGGCLGVKLTDYLAEKVVGFIGISAAIPESGNSFISCLPFPQKLLIPVVLSLLGAKPPKKSIELELCNDLSSQQSTEIVNRYTPESKSIYLTRVNYNPLPKRSLYIKLTNDKAFPIQAQDKMITNLNAKNTIELETGHLPMMSNPKELAKIINGFIRNE